MQLVPEAECTTCLIKAGFRPQAAGQRLIKQPSVDQGVKQRVRRFNLDLAQQVAPKRLGIFKGLYDVACSPSSCQQLGLRSISRVAQYKGKTRHYPRHDLKAAGYCGAGVQRVTMTLPQCVRPIQLACSVKKFIAITRPLKNTLHPCQRQERRTAAQPRAALALLRHHRINVWRPPCLKCAAV